MGPAITEPDARTSDQILDCARDQSLAWRGLRYDARTNVHGNSCYTVAYY